MRTWVKMPAVGLMLVGLVATQAAAQQKEKPEAQQDQCDIKTSHFAISKAMLYLQTAQNAQDSTKRAQALDGAHRSLIEALEKGEDQNPATWYFLGIYYALAGDAKGADSALDRTEQMMPSCAGETRQYRQHVWSKVANQGIEAMQKNDYESAKAAFHEANAVYPEDPTADFYLGTIYATADDADSALMFFRAAAKASAADTAWKEIREKSVQNLARIYQVLENWDSAQVYYQQYRALRPDDPESLSGLATAYLSGGDTARAVALYDSVLTNAGSMQAIDLFRIGVALFHTNNARLAAKAFEAGVKKAPYYRTGLYNLTNAYFSIAQDTPDSAASYAGKMLPVAHRLAQLDPQNRQVLRLIAAAYQLVGKNDSTDIMLKKANDMKFEVEVQTSRATENGFEVQGTITNTQKTATQVPTITFEFLNAEGAVVTTETVAAQSIEPNGAKQFQLTPTGQGIVAWRYKAS